MNLRTISHLSAAFDVPVGLSDHTLGLVAPVAAVTLGACMVERHFTLSCREGGLDSAFSMEPGEFRDMVESICSAERAMGEVSYRVTPDESKQRIFRRSLFVVRDVRAGEKLTSDNVRSIRPASVLAPHYLETILGRTLKKAVSRGTPLTLDLIDM